MTVLRIVANLQTPDPAGLAGFYATLFGLDQVMDHGFVVTLASFQAAPAQLSLARESGSGTAVPALSIEVDDLDEVLDRTHAMGVAIEYGPVIEPWAVRRVFLRDPAGTLINVLCHAG